jgi:zinc transporter ZupT
MSLKSFFWRKSAIVGIAWGFISFTQFFAGGVMPLHTFWKLVPSPIYYLLSFPLHATMSIFPEHLNISSTFIFYLYFSIFILTPLLIGMIICVSLDNIISKSIKKVSKGRKGAI